MCCPKCGKDGFILLTHEVDIGVDVQIHVYGGECSVCGQIARCQSCLAWDFQVHEDHCALNIGL